jgi:transposase-like protein
MSDLDIVAVMTDGVHFGDHCCLVALGIGIDGTKHPLGLAELDGARHRDERLLTDLRERGLDVSQPMLVVIAGAKALASAVKAVFDIRSSRRVSCTSPTLTNICRRTSDTP